MLPDALCHYYDCTHPPFCNLSELSTDDAETVLQQIREAGIGFASQRDMEYLQIRRAIESRVRELFIGIGGQPQRTTPHYMILGQCDWLKRWYAEGCELCIPLEKFCAKHISFTYGDSFPAMRYQDGKPYRGQVYMLEHLPDLIDQFGLPQVWNADGKKAPERYIEAQIWDDTIINNWLKQL